MLTTSSSRYPKPDLRTDLTRWEIGPYHAALPSPMRLKLQLEGEVIVSGEVETGFAHRGLEKALERHPWHSSMVYADRLDPEGAGFSELVLALAVEEIAGIEVPERGTRIRVVLTELNRIVSHMGYLVRVARAVQAETLMHYVLRDRERVLDLFELLTGARFTFNFIRFGGVKEDVTEGFIERVFESCELIRLRLKEYNDIFTFNETFLRRSIGVGQLHMDRVAIHGVTGPNARASGAARDIRKTDPYLGYERFNFEAPVGPAPGKSAGDAHDRFLARLQEISQSVEILRQALDTLPSGSFLARKVEAGFTVPAGEAYARIESARGLLGCHVVSDGSTHPSRIQFRPASRPNLEVLPELLEGIEISDLPVVLASMDLATPEADR